MLKRAAFIPPSNPLLRSEPPTGEGWLHEIKFDGYRAQLHKDGDQGVLLSKSGKDFTSRFKGIARAFALLPVRSTVVDAEIVACDAHGRPDFCALHSGAKEGLCAWGFDLLSLDGESLIRQPLSIRRQRLEPLVKVLANQHLRYSESFEDALALLQQAAVMGLEGIVSKRTDQPYVSGTNRSWVKVKTHDWLEANKDRGELFEKRYCGGFQSGHAILQTNSRSERYGSRMPLGAISVAGEPRASKPKKRRYSFPHDV